MTAGNAKFLSQRNEQVLASISGELHGDGTEIDSARRLRIFQFNFCIFIEILMKIKSGSYFYFSIGTSKYFEVHRSDNFNLFFERHNTWKIISPGYFHLRQKSEINFCSDFNGSTRMPAFNFIRPKWRRATGSRPSYSLEIILQTLRSRKRPTWRKSDHSTVSKRKFIFQWRKSMSPALTLTVADGTIFPSVHANT